MVVFDDRRVSAMRAALTTYGKTFRPFRNAEFVAALHAGEETLRIAIARGEGSIEVRTEENPTFGLRGAADSWAGYFTGAGPVSRGSVIGMVVDAQVSGGVLPAELAPEGDPRKLFANWPIVNRLLEAARATEEVSA